MLLLVFLSTSVLASNMDHSEELRLLDSYPDQNMLSISEVRIFSEGMDDFFTLQSEESLRVDYFKNNILKMDVFFDNNYNKLDSNNKLGFYDVRLTVQSLDPNLDLKHTFYIKELYTSDFSTMELTNIGTMKKGVYPIEVILTGRNRARKVHSDKAVFYMNVGIAADNTDIKTPEMEKEIRNKEVFKGVMWFLGILMVVVLIVVYFGYRKFTKDEDEDLY